MLEEVARDVLELQRTPAKRDPASKAVTAVVLDPVPLLLFHELLQLFWPHRLLGFLKVFINANKALISCGSHFRLEMAQLSQQGVLRGKEEE